MKLLTDGLQLDSWLMPGHRQKTPTLPDLARWIVARNPDARVLDTGTGSGELLRQLELAGIPRRRLFGCDIEPDHVALAQRTTGLGQIACANFEDGNPFDLPFDVVCSINWLQSDWENEYPTRIEKQAPDPDRLEQVIAAARGSLAEGGVWCWDFHGNDAGAAFLRQLILHGWRLTGQLRFPHDDRYPENYSIYCCEPPK